MGLAAVSDGDQVSLSGVSAFVTMNLFKLATDRVSPCTAAWGSRVGNGPGCRTRQHPQEAQLKRLNEFAFVGHNLDLSEPGSEVSLLPTRHGPCEFTPRDSDA